MVGRRILIASGAIGAVMLISVLLVLGAVLMLPADRIGAFAAERAEAVLDRDVKVESFRIRLWPRPSVSLERVAVGGPRAQQIAAAALAAPDTMTAEVVDAVMTRQDSVTPFAAVRRIDLRPKLLPLLRRRVVVEEIVLDQPRLVVEIAADGTTNLPVLEAERDAAGGDAELRINQLHVKDALIGYVDQASGTVVRLTGVDQRLRLDGSITAGELSRVALDGVLSIASVDANLPGLAFPLRDLSLRIEHRLDLDRAADRLEIETLKLELQEVALDVAGSVQAVSDSTARTVTLSASTGSFDVARLIASLPPELLEIGDGVVLSAAGGRASVDVTASGRVGGGVLPDVNGLLRLDDIALARGSIGNIVTNLNGRLAFSLDSLASDDVIGTLLGKPLNLAFNIHDFAAPRGQVSVQAALALEQAQRLGLLAEGWRGKGNVTLDVTAAGALMEPADVRLSGRVALVGIELDVPSLERPLAVQDGRIELRGREAAATGLHARIGQSDIVLDIDAADWLPYALGDSTRAPTIAFDARSSLFDADEVFGPDDSPYTYNQLFIARLTDTPVDGLSAAEAAEAVGLGLPEMPPVRLDGRIRAARFVRAGTTFDDVDLTIAARDGELELRGASFSMMGGGVHLSGHLGPAAGRTREGVTQPLTLDYAVSDVTADDFLHRFTTFRDRVGGALLLAGSARMNLDRHLLPERESLGGEGTIGFIQGMLANWPLGRALGEQLGLGSLDTLSFSDWTGRYRVAGSAVVLEETLLEAGDLAVRAAGSFHLTGNLDIGATVYVPAHVASRLPGAPAAFAVNVASGADGRVPIGARISGTAARPSIRLDLSEAGALAANRAREAAQAEAKSLAERAIGEDLVERLPPRDSLAAAADSLKQKVEGDVVNRLRRLVRPPGGGP